MAHPLLAHAHDPEFLKTHLQYADWDSKYVFSPPAPASLFIQLARKTQVIVDRCGRIIGVLIAPPLPGEEWESIVQAATTAMREARDKMTFPVGAYHHRRSYSDGFPTGSQGFAFGGGRENLGNIKASSAWNAAAMEELLEDPNVVRMTTYPIRPLFLPYQAFCYLIFADYHTTKQVLVRKNPGLRRTFTRSPFAAVTVNLGPVSVSLPHTDAANKADGMCLIGALGSFDADKGGQLVCWDYDLIIRFPPGCSILIPSAVVTHSNTPIRDGEERFSIIQYTAGGLFRWVANGFQSDRSWLASASAEDLARREEERKARCADALKKFPLWKDVKVRNFSGRGRVEVWDSGDVTDFSNLTDCESEGERPAKRKRQT
ncbi:hypothetical protein DFH08DRAFT_715411 [Mycena albidolilacea]|uniref:Uncharacterized protein n=1 Tax=Mycena albidolilacea TaxID=1033008 RepID=A0AAD6ZCQ6_9AGAR|nr:hypothetical protein DFH08DRAFT_715411 [Mycena albidolilacea]